MSKPPSIILFPLYEEDKWLADLKWLITQEGSRGSLDQDAVFAYFNGKYGLQGMPRGSRALAALDYVSMHGEDFADGVLGVGRMQGFAASGLLMRALLPLYNAAPQERVQTDWPVETVREIARELPVE